MLAQRSQVDASLIEVGGLDLIMAVLSLALGLSRAGKRSTVERWGVVFMAAISASMNYAAANGGDWRSVLAWTMPPLALAFVVDRCVSVIRRHVLAMEDTGSPFLAAARAVGKVALFIGIALLYTLRLFLAPVETPKGMRRWVLNATPLPEAEPVKVTVIRPIKPREIKPRQRKAIEGGGRDGSKATNLIKLVIERYGSPAQFPLDRVSPVCKELAPLVGMDPGWAVPSSAKPFSTPRPTRTTENESEGQ